MRASNLIFTGLLLSQLSAWPGSQEVQPITLSAPVRVPISWLSSSNIAQTLATPGILRIDAPSATDVRAYVGTWSREKLAAGELCTFVLNMEGTLLATYTAVPPMTNYTGKGTWEVVNQAVRLQLPFTSPTNKTNVLALRELMLSIVQEDAGTVLVGEKGARFTRPKP